ncbi:uncharacterized protein LOC122301754 [Carya illinoinensis]|uniref:uncharacterized protein LOC122301754 n=1 Tax=Carya illinoinensis TaxID=32201 RepID=UPI001C7277C3|nr:uncharacterized protein LOC122301754 [Carya illinoinensis]
MKWNRQRRRGGGKDIEEKTAILQQLQADESQLNVNEIRTVKEELNRLLEKEDIRWRQRAKVNWYRLGDRNTKYFHSCANMRRKKNTIGQVLNEHNREVRGNKEIERAFSFYFKELFSSTNPSNAELAECLSGMEPWVTNKMNEMLIKDFSRFEIEVAMRQMAPMKSPGPDCFGACFYQSHWNQVADEVCDAALSVLNAYELIHSMKSRKKGREGSMAIKLDMSKAYDRIEWGFLEAVMKRIGFSEKWINLIMKCVTSVSYLVLINGKPGERFRPTRGLRQGDPLSPYLFILCVEGLSCLMEQSVRLRSIRGVQVSRGGYSINHLLFAYDCILFGKASLEDWHKLQGILKVYEKASGQYLNKEKASIFFSTNTSLVVKKSILSAGNLVVCGSYERYLGLPTVVGRSKFNTFRVLKEKIWHRISNWKNNFLSQAGKEVMIKAVLQAIPTYTMSVFKLPIRLCNEINTMFSKFWWGNHQKEGGIPWRKWEKMAGQKGNGGLGFRDLGCFNLALLAKQGWRLIKSPNSLVLVILREKYFKHSNFLDVKLGTKASLIWRSIWGARDLIKEGMRWRVGDGKKIKIWGHKWLSTPTSFSVQSPVSVLSLESNVEELLGERKGEWNEERVKAIFEEVEAKQILSIPLSKGMVEDKEIWGPSKKGIFTVRSAYFLQLDRRRRRLGESSRERGAANDLLPTRKNLFKKKIVEDPYCPICFKEEETTVHVLWECHAANDVWANSISGFQK